MQFPSISNLAQEFIISQIWNAYCTSGNVSLLHCCKSCWNDSSRIHIYHFIKLFHYRFILLFFLLFIMFLSLTAAYLDGRIFEAVAVCSSWKGLRGKWKNMLHLCFSMCVCMCERALEWECHPTAFFTLFFFLSLICYCCSTCTQG